MGLAVKVDGTFYTVTTPVAYRVGNSGSFYKTKRFLFYDPVSGVLKDGFTDNIAPEAVTDLDFSYSGTTGSSSYSADLTWTQSNDEQDNTDRNEFVRESTPTTSTDTFTQDPPPAEGASGTFTRAITGNGDTNLNYGSDRVRYKIRVVDEDEEASAYDTTSYKTLPPKLPTSPSITATTTVNNIPMPTFSWTRTTSNNTVDNYILNINRPSGTATETLAGTASSYTETSSTGYSGGGTVSYTITARSTRNSETTDSPVTTSSVSFVLPPQNLSANPTVSSSSNTSVTFNWSAPGGTFTAYRVYIDRYTSNTGTPITVVSNYQQTGTSYTYSPIPDNTYKVRIRVFVENGSTKSLASKEVTQLTPPPAASTPTLTCASGTWTASWTVSSTNLETQQVRYRDDTAESFTSYQTIPVGDRSFTFAGESGKTAEIQVRTRSLVGSSNQATSSAGSGTLPVTPSGLLARFNSGGFNANWTSNSNTSHLIQVYNANTTLNHSTTTTSSSYTASTGYFSAGDSGYFRMRGNNSFGSGYYSGNSTTVKKIANPLIIDPDYSYTFFTGFNTASARWQTSTVRQGVLDNALTSYSGDQELVGFFFYGNDFAQLTASNLGYQVNVDTGYDSLIRLDRQNSGGSASARPAFVIGHKYTVVNTALTSVDTYQSNGSASSSGTSINDTSNTGWDRNEVADGVLPDAFVTAMCFGTIQGFALRTGETSAPSSSVSTNYVRFEPYTINNCGRLTIYHTG